MPSVSSRRYGTLTTTKGGASLVLAGIPKYGLERPALHPYCLARSGHDPTPEYPRGPEPPRSAQSEAT
jgi:hypothetical protein